MSERVLVLNSFVKGWNILKALADDGFAVNAADYRRGAPGLFSNRIADPAANLIYPDPKTDEAGFVRTVLDHIDRHNFDIVLPVNAAEMMTLARHREEIETRAAFPFESYHKLLLLHDKKYFFEVMAALIDPDLLPRSWSIGDTTAPVTEILAAAGLPDVPCHPMPAFATPDEFLAAQAQATYPLIVKTRRSTSSVGVYRVPDETRLRAACDKLGNEDIIVQENLIGRGVGISSLRWDDPACLHHFGHKRVREYPISGGASTSREPWDVDDHPLAASLTEVLHRLDWHGVVMFELKEQADGRCVFLEANPRFWGSVPLAIVNGVNFPVLLCRAALKQPLPTVVNRKQIRARILFSDSLSLFLNLLCLRRIGYNLGDFFNFRNLFLDDLDASDWPGTRRIFGRMLAEFFSRLFGRSR